MAKLPNDKRILHIAAEVAETTDDNVPLLLLGIEGVLAEYIGTPAARQIKEDLWNYDLTHVTCLALKQDFSNIEGEWNTAARLSSILTTACTGFIASNNETEYKKQFLPDVVDSLLITSSRIQEEIAKAKENLIKQQLLQHFRVVLQGVTKMFQYYKFLTIEVISSKRYMQLLMSEEERTSLTMMLLTQNILKANRNVILELTDSKIHSIIDELVFKIAATSNASIASTAVRLLLLSIDLHSPLADVVSSKRYKGLKTYLSKWKDKASIADIQRLTDILEAKSAQHIEIMKRNRAAATIQAAYKGHQTRKSLQMATEGIRKFQRMFRQRKRQRAETDLMKTESKQKIDMEASRIRKEVMSSRKKQLKVMETIPARTVTKFLEDLQFESATRIQSYWRGHKTRKELAPKLTQLRKVQSIIKIQRQVRRWLTRCRAKHASLMMELLPPGLNDPRRVELQALISKMRDRFPPKQRTFEEQKELNNHTFRLLNDHFIQLNKMRSNEQHRNSLLAQLAINAEQLMAAPKLHEVRANDVDLFKSRSGPVITAARRQHNETLKRHWRPWWQKLADDEESDMFSRVKDNIESLNLANADLEKQF